MEQPKSKITKISGGNIEFAFTGDGPTVLVSHGTLGGFDQALAISQLFDQITFRFLCVSRAGYLRSSPSNGHTPEEQARSYVELLDRLGISKIAVLGVSGGTPSALRFAQNYPERCWALVLLSSISRTPQLPPPFQFMVRVQDITMRFDSLWALVYKYGLRMLLRSNGLSASQVEKVINDPHLYKVARGIFRPIKSASMRRTGVRLDDVQIQSLQDNVHYEISVPTYICHAVNDPLAPASDAAQLASSIHGASYLELPDGGHIFFVVHNERVIPPIEQFLLGKAPN